MTEFDVKHRHMEIEVHNLMRRNEGRLGLEPIKTSYSTALMLAAEEIEEHEINGDIEADFK